MFKSTADLSELLEDQSWVANRDRGEDRLGEDAVRLVDDARGRFLAQLWLDIIQYVLFFLPGMAMFLWLSWEFAEESWFFREELITSWRPPAYWYKTVIPVTAALLLLQGIAEVLKCFRALQTGVDYRKVEPSEVT